MLVKVQSKYQLSKNKRVEAAKKQVGTDNKDCDIGMKEAAKGEKQGKSDDN